MQVVTLRAAPVFLAILASAGCGGGSSPASPSPTPTPLGGPAPIVLDASNFDAWVLASTRPCLVGFHLPT